MPSAATAAVSYSLSLWLSTLLASRRAALKSPSRHLEMPCLSGNCSEEGRSQAGRECRHSAMAVRQLLLNSPLCVVPL